MPSHGGVGQRLAHRLPGRRGALASHSLYDGALPGGYGVRGGVSLPSGLGQDRHGAEAAPPPALLRHLVVAGVKVFLALAQPLLQEGRVAATARARPPIAGNFDLSFCSSNFSISIGFSGGGIAAESSLTSSFSSTSSAIVFSSWLISPAALVSCRSESSYLS